MQMSLLVEALQRDLAAIAAAGDSALGEAAQRIAAALEAPLRLRLLEALGQAARELGTQLPGGGVEVRLVGTDPVLTYAEERAPSGPSAGEEGLTARITLRLPERLKTHVEQAASQERVSVNAWILQALRNAAGRGGPRIGRRLTGFARS